MYCRNCGEEISKKTKFCPSCGVSPLKEKNHCQECGAETSENQEVCVECGTQLKFNSGSGVKLDNEKIYPSDPPKSSTTETILSCLLTGAGQMYLGQVAKGIVWLIGGIAISVLTGGFLGLPIWITSMIDANSIGKKLENGQAVEQWEFF